MESNNAFNLPMEKQMEQEFKDEILALFKKYNVSLLEYHDEEDYHYITYRLVGNNIDMNIKELQQ